MNTSKTKTAKTAGTKKATAKTTGTKKAAQPKKSLLDKAADGELSGKEFNAAIKSKKGTKNAIAKTAGTKTKAAMGATKKTRTPKKETAPVVDTKVTEALSPEAALKSMLVAEAKAGKLAWKNNGLKVTEVGECEVDGKYCFSFTLADGSIVRYFPKSVKRYFTI